MFIALLLSPVQNIHEHPSFHEVDGFYYKSQRTIARGTMRRLFEETKPWQLLVLETKSPIQGLARLF
jgi:hypothetical protein